MESPLPSLASGVAASSAADVPDRGVTGESFVRLAHRHFDFLVLEHGFTSDDEEALLPCAVQSVRVCYQAPALRLLVGWTDREGPEITIEARRDTAWIRPASSHVYGFREFLRQSFPGALEGLPRISQARTEADYDGWLAYNARQLREHGASLLKGDLAVCEDILIMRYCNSTRGLPMEDYFKIFREECTPLPADALSQLEAAMAARSPRQVFFLLQPWVVESRLLRSPRLLKALNEFWLQYFQ